jgi:hypothetical protein
MAAFCQAIRYNSFSCPTLLPTNYVKIDFSAFLIKSRSLVVQMPFLSWSPAVSGQRKHSWLSRSVTGFVKPFKGTQQQHHQQQKAARK